MKSLSILLLFLILRSIDSKAQNSVCLNNQTNFYMGNVIGPGKYEVADFNNDNFPDFAFPVGSDYSVSLVLSTSSNSYALPLNTGISIKPGTLHSADINNDGNMDLVILPTDSMRLAFAYGNGNGTFTNTIKYNILDFPWAITSADLNNDGFTDFAVCTLTSGFYVFNSNGSSSYTPSYYPAQAGFILIDDYNNDGLNDLHIHDNNMGPYFMKNNGNGLFVFETNAPIAGGQSFDLNNDGLNDLIGLSSGSLVISLNLGNFNFGTPSLSNTPAQSISGMASGDINSDGKKDIVISEYYGGKIAIHLNSGLGGFLAPIVYTTSPNIIFMESITSADVDNNGKADIIVSVDNTFSGIYVIYNCLTTKINETTGISKNVELFPNPSSGLFYINSDIDIKSIEILDINCKIINKKEINLNEIDIREKENGIYFLRIKTANGDIRNFKLVKTD